MLVAGAVMLGFGEHAIWLGGAALETAYLYALATNPRFQNWVDGGGAVADGDGQLSTEEMMSSLDGAQRQRAWNLEEKVRRIKLLYRQSEHEDYLYESNLDALRKLTTLYVRLLVAQRHQRTLSANAKEADLRKQVAAIERELSLSTLSPTLRESKEATLAILQQRLVNLGRRAETLAEIDSDLTRIEQQVDLAAEDASLKDRPTAISANINLVSHLLDDTYDVPPVPAPPKPEIEN